MYGYARVEFTAEATCFHPGTTTGNKKVSFRPIYTLVGKDISHTSSDERSISKSVGI